LPATPAAADPLLLYIKASDSGQCVAVRESPVVDGRIVNGTSVVERSCSDPLSVRWELRVQPDRGYRIVEARSGMCLDVTYASEDEGAPLQLWQCLDSSWNQRFRVSRLIGDQSGLYQIVPQHTGSKCADVWRTHPASRPLIVQSTCNVARPSQDFSFHTR
jgi:hypothetical protein